MRKNPNPPYSAVQQGKMALPAAVADEMVALFSAGQWESLANKALTATMRYPAQPFVWKALGKAQFYLGRLSQALTALLRVAKLTPGDADAHHDLGLVYHGLGRLADAEASFRLSLQLSPQQALAHTNLGVLLTAMGRLEEAVASHQQSLRINPNGVGAHNNLGSALRDLGRLREAEASFRRALELDPAHVEAWVNLGTTLNDLSQFDEGQGCYRRALALNPDSDTALFLLGSQLSRLGGKDEEALACLERSLALNPSSVDTYVALGNALLRMGQMEKSWAMFRHAQELRPLITWPARKEKADFSVLLLDTPGAGSTPVDYLQGSATYERNFYCVMPGTQPPLELLAAKADVVVNLIADADNGKDILPFALDLADRLGRPTVNHPRLIMHTDRESIARRLANTPRCRIPRTIRLPGHALAAAAGSGIAGFTLPLLARFAGTHGGDDLDKFEDWNDVAKFALVRPDADYYLTEYADYRSADGFFRKYRMIYIDGELFPYHLAIHSDWKVHHFRTDMANQAWMREEEEAFLKHCHLVFDEQHQTALRAVGAATELNYCGIDCALNAQNEIVVFETNAAMLVHDEKDETFAYKNPYIAKIKDAFDAMLVRLATGTKATP